MRHSDQVWCREARLPLALQLTKRRRGSCLLVEEACGRGRVWRIKNEKLERRWLRVVGCAWC